MVTAVKGKAAVSEDGAKWTTATVMKSLGPATQLKVSEGTLEVALFKDGTRMTVVAPALVKVTGGGLELVQGKPDQLVAKATRKTASGKAVKPAGVSMGGHLMRSGPKYFILSAGFVRSDRPRLVWTGAQGFTRYQVALMNSVDEKVWEGEVEGTEMDYPAQAPALAEGEFITLLVNAHGEGPSPGSLKAELEVLPESEVSYIEALEKVLDPTDPGDLAVLASHYLKHQMWFDALGAGEKLRQLQPDNPGTYRYLFKVCAALNMVDKATEYRDKAERLEKL